MKKNDILTIVVVGIVAAVFSLIASNLLFTPNSTKVLKAQKVDAIESTFNSPDKRYFNNQSINPTQLIQIGDTTNAQPF